MTRVAIIAAMPGELKPLVKDWRHENRDGVDVWRVIQDQSEWVAACAGAGASAAGRAFAAIEKDGSVSSVISIGWAGALTGDIAVGKAYVVSGVIDARTGERYYCADTPYERWLVTAARVADEAEKRRLASTYRAALVDMEAAAIARLAAMRNIPFHCIKGVSDGLDAKLPDFNRFISPGGQFELGKFVLFAIPRFWYWPALMQMGENSSKASKSMAELLLTHLDDRGHTG